MPIFNDSRTSAEPLLLLTERLPCLATIPPAAATTNEAAVETLNKFAPSPPVPTISTAFSVSISTFVESDLIAFTAPDISSIVSPFIRIATNNAPI